MVRVVVAAVLASIGIWVSGCAGTAVGGEDDAGGGSAGSSTTPPAQPAEAPAKQCQTYVNTWCTRSFNCYVEVDRLDAGSKKYNIDQCKKLVAEKLPCSGVTGVGNSYPTCISQIKAMACSNWDVPQEQFAMVPFPTSCDEALAF